MNRLFINRLHYFRLFVREMLFECHIIGLPSMIMNHYLEPISQDPIIRYTLQDDREGIFSEASIEDKNFSEYELTGKKVDVDDIDKLIDDIDDVLGGHDDI